MVDFDVGDDVDLGCVCCIIYWVSLVLLVCGVEVG